ncbi:MAG: hypothetical protein ACR2QE_01130 [Acidimicrobiales bacterium]
MSTPSLADDEATLARHADELVDGLRANLGAWVIRGVRKVADSQGIALDDAAAQQAASAAAACTREVGDQVAELLGTDIDAQPTNPLQLIRAAVSYPTDVLASLGAEPVERDPFVARTFPDDVYDLAPATFADIDPSLHDPGLTWGAAKAHVHLRRRRTEGRR